MKPCKVFGIGLNKTGTKTLQRALLGLGYQRHQSCRRDLLAAYRAGRIEDVFAVTDANESFEDWPYPLLFRDLYFRYGDGARYILTTRRDAAVWRATAASSKGRASRRTMEIASRGQCPRQAPRPSQ